MTVVLPSYTLKYYCFFLSKALCLYANPGVTHSDTLHSSRVTVWVTLGLTMMMLNWLAADAFEQHRSVICNSVISTLNKKQLLALLNLFILIIESVHELIKKWCSPCLTRVFSVLIVFTLSDKSLLCAHSVHLV